MAVPRRLPPLSQLRAFEAAARHGSFKAGAGELCVTQAAVSHQIKALEDWIGRQLFVRRTRAVELTPEARTLATSLTRALDEIEAAVLDLSGTEMTGEITVSVAPFYGNRWLLPRLQGFLDEHPGLSVVPRLSFEQADLAASGLDAAIRYGGGDWPGLAAITIHHDCIGPVAAPQLVAGRDLPLAPSEIAALPRVTTSRWGDDWHDWFAAAGTDAASAPPAMPYDSRALAFDAALSGNAVCLSDIRLTASAEAAGNLVRLSPVTIERSQGIHMVFPAGRRADPRVTALAEWLRAEAQAAARDHGTVAT